MKPEMSRNGIRIGISGSRAYRDLSKGLVEGATMVEMDQAIRNKLRNVVTQCRKLLEEATSQQLQGRYGIYAVGKKDELTVEKDDRMTHLTDEERSARQDILAHFEHIQALGYRPESRSTN